MPLDILWTIFIFIVVLGLLVFIHELGHFVAAKRSGVRVDEFGFGFPPKLFGKKIGETLYSINLIPLGGFVRIKGVGEDVDAQTAVTGLPPATPDADSFDAQSFPRKLLILFAGIGMNLVLAVIIFAVIFTSGFEFGAQSAPAGGTVTAARLLVQGTIAGSPADTAGVEPGDVILSVNRASIADVAQLKTVLQPLADQTVPLTIERAGQTQELTITPAYLQTVPTLPSNSDQPSVSIGVSTVDLVTKNFPWYEGVWVAITHTAGFLLMIALFLFDMVKGLFMNTAVDTSGVQGPIGLATTLGSIASLGFKPLLYAAGAISVNLAFFNLLPIPLLDGGRIFFVMLERLRGKPLNRNVEALIYNIAFLLLIGMVILVSVRDVRNL
jgi:regulator of sigma E protease